MDFHNTWIGFGGAGQSDSEPPFTSIDRARTWAELARSVGYDAEIIRCEGLAEFGAGPDAQRAGAFLGWDVSRLSGSNFSVVVDCIGLWEASFVRGQRQHTTPECVAEYFNALLNEQRLFPDAGTAQRFLAASRECVKAFGGDETALEAEAVAVFSVPG